MNKTEIEKARYQLGLLDKQDIVAITGWNEKTVAKLMSQSDFPAIELGRKKQVLLQDLQDYLSYKRTTKDTTR